VRDIKERRRVEERLREQAARPEKATKAILVCGLKDGIRFWNQRAKRLYGWTGAEAFDRNANQLHFKGAAPVLDEARRTVLEKGDWTGELRQATKDGKEGHWGKSLDAAAR
jgi:PAS domain S-box-containing protein